jgi:23S rRNA pseudouridine2605 synthase
MKTRIAKFISDCGVASRRGAEDLIKSGRVSVNGAVVDTPVFFVDENDIVSIDGKKIQKQNEIKLYMFNKPINTMTTAHDPENRKTIYDVLDKKYKNLKYIGRLDFKTTGLLLLTNDGNLARQMSLPKNQIERTYIATVNKFDERGLNIARRGVVIDKIKYRPMKIEIIDEHNLKVTVTEGKKNEIRIVLKHIGSPVVNLHRISYGPIMLGKLGVGKILEVDKKTVDLVLKNF